MPDLRLIFVTGRCGTLLGARCCPAMEQTRHSCVVMMVDDEPVLRTLVSYTLEDAEFTVIEAASADEALRILEREADGVHVVFTDVQMPGSMDGRALAHHVNRRWPHLGVIVTSAHPLSPHHLPDGCRFLTKPYDLGDVLDHVQTMTLASC